MRTPRLLLAALAGTAALLAASSAVADNQTVDATVNDVFSPAKTAVKPGETVTFTNSGGEHNVVWNDGKEPPEPSADAVDASQWPPVGGVARTFPTSGKFRYYCVAHGDRNVDFGMVGYVYVNPVGAIPPAVTGPDGVRDPHQGDAEVPLLARGEGQGDVLPQVRTPVRAQRHRRPSRPARGGRRRRSRAPSRRAAGASRSS